MNRTYQLSFCKRCSNKQFDRIKGIVCSHTNETATFEETCPHFEEAELTEEKRIYRPTNSRKAYNSTGEKLRGRYNGFLITLYGALVLIIPGVILMLNREDVGVLFYILGAFSAIMAAIYSMTIIYKLWDIILQEAKIHKLEMPVQSPGQAVGFLFIPLFNFYWIFIAIGKLPGSLNEIAKRRGSKYIAPDGLGLIISIFSVSVIIPYLGIILGLLSGYVLLPILFNQLIKTTDNLPPSSAIKHSFGSDHVVENYNITTYTDIFHTHKLGFNFYLPLFMIPITFIINMISMTVNMGFRDISSVLSAGTLSNSLSSTIVTFAFIGLCHLIKNKHILAFSTGGLFAVNNIINNILIYYRYGEYGDFQLFNAHYSLISFFYGIILIYGLSLAIENFGIRYWSILLAMFSIQLLQSGINYGIEAILGSFNFRLSYYSVVYPLLFVLGSSLAYYLGIIVYLKPIKYKSQIQVKPVNTLDADL